MSKIFDGKITKVVWFEEPTCTVDLSKKEDQLRLAKDWYFNVITEKTVKGIKIEKSIEFKVSNGFEYEGSVPRIFWVVITPTEPGAWAGYCIHDFMYIAVKMGLCTRAEADRLLYLALKMHYGEPKPSTVYSGVRVGGWWNAGKKLTAQEKLDGQWLLETFGKAV
jgi:Protein of unknown function (DUF1353)